MHAQSVNPFRIEAEERRTQDVFVKARLHLPSPDAWTVTRGLGCMAGTTQKTTMPTRRRASGSQGNRREARSGIGQKYIPRYDGGMAQAVGGVERILRTPALRWLYEALTFVGEVTVLAWQGFARIFHRPFELKETLNQMAFVGVSSVPIIALTTFSSGAVIALYSANLLQDYGASGLAGGTVALSVTRELAPVLVGIMVAARCGSAMAAQIATMAVTEQIDALKSLRVSPVSYLVVPRLIACLTMLPVLAVVGMYAGIAGGYLVAVPVAGIPHGLFIHSLQQFTTMHDVGGGILKTVVFGLIVALVACQQGLRTEGGAVGVGHATTRTVVLTMVLIYVANYFLTAALYS